MPTIIDSDHGVAVWNDGPAPNPAAAIHRVLSRPVGAGRWTAPLGWAAVGRLVGEHGHHWQRYVEGAKVPRATKVEDWCRAGGVTVTCDGRGWRAER